MATITDKIDRVTGIPDEYRREVCPPPISVKIELTGRCNFACDFCARSDMLREQKDMDPKLYRALVAEMAWAGVKELGVFYLGESFMVPWLPDAIRYAKDVGFEYVFLTTNGSLATADKVEACMRAGLDSLKWSLNWADAEQFAKVTHTKPALFDKVLANVRAAYAVREMYGFECGLYASYIEYDDAQVSKMEALLEQVRPYVDEVYALPLYNQAGFVSEKERAAGWSASPGNRGRAENLRDPLPCWACFTEGHVTWDGKLSACCFDHADRFVMGDLTRQRFMDAWNSEAFRSLRRAHLARDVRGTACAECMVA